MKKAGGGWHYLDKMGCLYSSGVLDIKADNMFDKPYFASSVWQSLYKTSVYGKLRFCEELRFGEDTIWFLDCITTEKTLYLLDEYLYNYTIGGNFIKKYQGDDILKQYALIGYGEAEHYRKAGREDYALACLFERYYEAVRAAIYIPKCYKSNKKELATMRRCMNTRKGYKRCIENYKRGRDSSFANRGERIKTKLFFALTHYRLLFLYRLIAYITHWHM